MTRLTKLPSALLDELRDIWQTRNARTRIILYQADGLALALVTLGRCAIGDTISSTAWRLEQAGKFWGCMRPVIDWLFSGMEADHCKGAYQTYLRITGASR